MPFTIRPHRRFPVSCPVTYQTGFIQSHCTLWNFSLSGLRFTGGVTLCVEQPVAQSRP